MTLKDSSPACKLLLGDDSKRGRPSVAITKYVIASYVEAAGQQRRKLNDSLARRLHLERRAIRIRRMNIDGVVRAVPWRDSCKHLVLALMGALLDLGARQKALSNTAKWRRRSNRLRSPKPFQSKC